MKHIKKFEEINESLGETKMQRLYKAALGLFLAPISIPIFANLSTENKIKILKKNIVENYIEELAEYEIIDEYKYDIEMPSLLNKTFKRLKMIKKKKDKYKTISDYIDSGIKFLRLCNIINFKNREDIDYIEEKVKDYFSKRTDAEWISKAKSKLKIKNGIVKRNDIGDEIGDILNGIQDMIDRNPNFGQIEEEY